MWIHNKKILLNVSFTHDCLGKNLSISMFDQTFNNVNFDNTTLIDKKRQTISALITMPTTLYLVIDKKSFSPVTVTDISLGNIPFQTNLIPQVFEYKLNCEQKNYSLQELLGLTSYRTDVLLYSGVMCFNFFDNNPIAYHMHLGNTISVL